MKKADTDFRQTFARLAPQAIVTRDELAALLATSVGAIAQMTYRGELPQTAFPDKRRACWFAADIRDWLNDVAARRAGRDAPVPVEASSDMTRPRIGRPRHATGE